MPKRVIIEQLQHSQTRASTDTTFAVVECHDDSLARSVEALANLTCQDVGHDVGGHGIEAAFGDDDALVLLCKGVVFGDHVVDPGYFAGAVEVVCSVIGAGGEDGLTVKHEWAYGSYDETCSLCKSFQLVFLEFTCFDVW